MNQEQIIREAAETYYHDGFSFPEGKYRSQYVEDAVKIATYVLSFAKQRGLELVDVSIDKSIEKTLEDICDDHSEMFHDVDDEPTERALTEENGLAAIHEAYKLGAARERERMMKIENASKVQSKQVELDCPFDFTSRCTMGRCDCKPKEYKPTNIAAFYERDVMMHFAEFTSLMNFNYDVCAEAWVRWNQRDSCEEWKTTSELLEIFDNETPKP